MKCFVIALTLFVLCPESVMAQSPFSRNSLARAVEPLKMDIVSEDYGRIDLGRGDLFYFFDFEIQKQRFEKLITDFLPTVKTKNSYDGPFNSRIFLGIESGSPSLRVDLSSAQATIYQRMLQSISDKPWEPSYRAVFILYPLAEISAQKKLDYYIASAGFRAYIANHTYSKIDIESNFIDFRIEREYQLAVSFFIAISTQAP